MYICIYYTYTYIYTYIYIYILSKLLCIIIQKCSSIAFKVTFITHLGDVAPALKRVGGIVEHNPPTR